MSKRMEVRGGGFRLSRRAGAGVVEGRAMLMSGGFRQECWGGTLRDSQQERGKRRRAFHMGLRLQRPMCIRGELPGARRLAMISGR